MSQSGHFIVIFGILGNLPVDSGENNVENN